jgi:hypothetical protein
MDLIEPYMNWIYLAAIVIALLILASVMIRVFGSKVRARKGARLGISEYYEVDKSRFLVLVRRDDVEHLVLVGGGQDVVIESGIRPDTTAATPGRRVFTTEDLDTMNEVRPGPVVPNPDPAGVADGNVRPITARPAPRPPVFGSPLAGNEPSGPRLRAVDRDPE